MKKCFVIVFLAGGGILWGCQPKPNAADLVKKIVVTTDYNANDFSKYSSYYLSMDTLFYYNPSSDYYPGDTLQCTTCKKVYNSYWGDYPSMITQKLKSKMDSVGFTSVGAKQSPDLVIYVQIVENYSVSQSYTYYPYGYYYGSYGSYYPTYNVSEVADLQILIFDFKNRNSKGQPTWVWFCSMGDLVSSPDFVSRTVNGLNQAFKQSTYLKK
jgi:hypothetical protein